MALVPAPWRANASPWILDTEGRGADGWTDGQRQQYFTKIRDVVKKEEPPLSSAPFLGPAPCPVPTPYPGPGPSHVAVICRAGGHGCHRSCCAPACRPAQRRGSAPGAGWAGRGWAQCLMHWQSGCRQHSCPGRGWRSGAVSAAAGGHAVAGAAPRPFPLSVRERRDGVEVSKGYGRCGGRLRGCLGL